MADSRNLRWVRWSVKWQGRLQGEFGVLPIFRTKRECQAYIKERYGHIAKRADLRAPPHNWRMPQPVRVVTVEVIEE